MTLEKVEEKIKYWQKVKELLMQELPLNASLDTIIYKKYLEIENVKVVADWINEQGYRRKNATTGNEIKYTSNDITERLKDKNAQVSSELRDCVKQLFLQHKAYINKRYN